MSTASALYEAGAAVLLSGGDPGRTQELLEQALALPPGADPLSHTMALTTLALTLL